MNDIIQENFLHLRGLALDIDSHIISDTAVDPRLANELAGMFAVTVAATYEGIVKETLVNYASRFHSKYQEHVEKDFDRLNAKISLDDLRNYSRRFGLNSWTGTEAKKNSTTFHRILKERGKIVERRYRADLILSYESLLQWRNAYAHQRSTSATFRDVYRAHQVGQHVIRSFVTAFEVG